MLKNTTLPFKYRLQETEGTIITSILDPQEELVFIFVFCTDYTSITKQLIGMKIMRKWL